MLKKIFFSSCISIALVNNGFGQETWGLERCITQAQANNRSIKQAQLGVANAKVNLQQDQWSRYPSLSANSNLGFNFGRSINPSTYQFETSGSTYNGWSLSSNAILYAGGRIQQQIRQSTVDVQVANADAEAVANATALSVAQAYLQILLFDEQLENAKKRLQQAQNQLVNTERQVKAGALAANARFDIEATIAVNEQTIVGAQNNLEIGYLNLKQLLELSPDYELKIEKPQLDVDKEGNPDLFVLKTVYNQALTTQPNLRANDLRIKSAEIGVHIAKAGYLPTLSIGGSLNSNYSSTILDYTKGTLVTTDVTQPVRINGVPATITSTQVRLTDNPKMGYFKQIGDNFGEGVTLNLSIPIFDQNRTKFNVERAKLNIQSRQLEQDKAQQQLKSDVQVAIANAKAAKKSFQATTKTQEARKTAYENTEKRFQIGGTSSFEYAQAKINLDTAERDKILAKYEYIFKMKIVEFYEGKKLNLK
jgi:outer membrane protein